MTELLDRTDFANFHRFFQNALSCFNAESVVSCLLLSPRALLCSLTMLRNSCGFSLIFWRARFFNVLELLVNLSRGLRWWFDFSFNFIRLFSLSNWVTAVENREAASDVDSSSDSKPNERGNLLKRA